MPSPLHSGETLTTSGQQIVHDYHFLPWFQGISLDFQVSLWVENRHVVGTSLRTVLVCSAQELMRGYHLGHGFNPPGCFLAV